MLTAGALPVHTLSFSLTRTHVRTCCKKKDDMEFLRILMSEINLTVPFSQVIRIGVAEKTRGVPRPMRARTTCITDQRKILKAASILRDTEYYKDTYIKRDETPLERAQKKKLNVLRKSKTERPLDVFLLQRR